MTQKALYDLVSGTSPPHLSHLPLTYMSYIHWLSRSHVIPISRLFCSPFSLPEIFSSRHMSGLLISLQVVTRKATLSKISVLALLHHLSQYPYLAFYSWHLSVFGITFFFFSSSFICFLHWNVSYMRAGI